MAIYMIISKAATGIVMPESVIRGTSPSNALNNFVNNGRGAYTAEDYSAFNTGWADGRFPVPSPGDNMHWEWDVTAGQPVAVANPVIPLPIDPARGYIVARHNNEDLSSRSIIEIPGDGVATATISIQKREVDGTDKAADDPAETITIRPDQLVTIDTTTVTLDSSGLGSFTVGPESRKGGPVTFRLDCDTFGRIFVSIRYV